MATHNNNDSVQAPAKAEPGHILGTVRAIPFEIH
jgi:hypothetical protein